MFLDFYNNLNPYLQILIVLGISLVIGYVLRFIILRVLKSTAKKSHDIFKRSVFSRIKDSWLLFIPMIIFLVIFPRENLDETTVEYIVKITQTLIIISFAIVAIRLVGVIQDVVVDKYNIDKADNIKERKIRTQLSFIRKIVILIILVIASSLILLNIDGVRKYGAAIVTSAGVAGIIIGFAAQKSLGNLLAGFQIAFTQPIKIDDAVVVENEWGWIEEINLTYVVIRIWDWRRLIVPITYFVEKPFQNWTRVTADLLGAVFLYVDYTVPLKHLRDEFDRILENSPLWDKKDKVLQVTESTEKSMQIRMLMSAKNSPQAWDLRCEVREKMIDFIQQHYPQSLPHTRASITDLRG